MDGKKEVRTIVKTIRLDDGKPWFCGNGHLLGVMRRERLGRDSAKGYRLYLLRDAVDTLPEPLVWLPWIGRVEGTMRNIQCSVCGAEKTWWAGKASIEKLLAGMGVDDPEAALELANEERTVKDAKDAENTPA